MRCVRCTEMEQSLGKKLRSAREAAGITVDDAVYLAKMPRAVVTALEAEDFGFFTSPLYARSFLKQYSTYVGVDVDPWLDSLLPITLIDGDALDSYIDLSENVPVVKKTSVKSTSSGGAMAAVWMILITGGLVWGGVKAYEHLDKRLSESTSDTKKNSTSPTDSEPNSEPATSPEDTEAEFAETPKEPEEAPVASTDPEPPRRAIIVREE